MAALKNVFVTDKRRVWMRLRDHVVIFERHPQFARFQADPSGTLLHILRIWVACPELESPKIRHYLGSVRHWDCGGWMTHRELLRLFRRATVVARHLGEHAGTFRGRLARFLREYLAE